MDVTKKQQVDDHDYVIEIGHSMVLVDNLHRQMAHADTTKLVIMTNQNVNNNNDETAPI